MQMSDFRPARDFAARYGVKSVVYGKPGTGKTPIASTAPRPLICKIEPGFISMRNSTTPTAECDTPEKIDDFFAWLKSSHETKNFDTIAVDSAAQMAELYLKRELSGKSKSGNKVDGKAAYGAMSIAVMEKLDFLYTLQQKHIYLICKQGYREQTGVQVAYPYFPGQDLNVKVPHLFDLVMQVGVHSVPGVGQVKAFRCHETYDATARDRSGNLAEFEPCDLTALFNKFMA